MNFSPPVCRVCVCELRYARWNSKMCKECDGNSGWILAFMDDVMPRNVAVAVAFFFPFYLFTYLFIFAVSWNTEFEMPSHGDTVASAAIEMEEWWAGDAKSIREWTNLRISFCLYFFVEYAMRAFSSYYMEKCAPVLTYMTYSMFNQFCISYVRRRRAEIILLVSTKR